MRPEDGLDTQRICWRVLGLQSGTCLLGLLKQCQLCGPLGAVGHGLGLLARLALSQLGKDEYGS